MTIALFLPSLLLAQDVKKHLRSGNSAYQEGNMEQAKKSYSKALEIAPDNEKALFNNGDALYRQEKFAEAAQHFEMATAKIENPIERASAWHNYGNAMLQAQDYGKSVQAYKNALKANPNDEDTRYNLAYAQQKLKQQQEQQQEDQENKDQENQEEKENEEKNEGENDQENKDQNKEQNEQGDQQDQKDQQNQQDQQQPADPQRLSKEEAERMLNALNNQEKNVQDKVKKKKMKVGVLKVEKDW